MAKCDHQDCEREAEPAILTVFDDDGEIAEEARFMLCPAHTADLLNAVEAK